MQSPALHTPKPNKAIGSRIFEFSDLQSFLKAVIENKKSKNPRWSLGMWAKQLGLHGSGTLSNFISGRRVPSEPILQKIIQGFEFSEYEAQYFDALVALAVKGTHPMAKRVANAAFALEKSGEQYLELQDKEFEAISNPLFLVLREIVSLHGFIQDDAEWIQNRLTLIKASKEEITQAFALLIDIGLLKRQNGKLVQTEAHYKTPSDQQSAAVRKFYESSLELNQRAIHEILPEDRHFNCINFSCNSEDLPEIKKMIHEFSRRLMEKFDRQDANTVYQVHTQLVPQVVVKK